MAGKGEGRRPRFLRWILIFTLAAVLTVTYLTRDLIITAVCWGYELPRTQLKILSPMRESIRTVFENWEKPESRVNAEATIAEVINDELPKGSTTEDIEAHIGRHFRRGTPIHPHIWLRTGEDGVYESPHYHVLIVKGCAVPRLWTGFRLALYYVSLEGIYQRTEIKYVGSKGYTYPPEILIAPEE